MFVDRTQKAEYPRRDGPKMSQPRKHPPKPAKVTNSSSSGGSMNKIIRDSVHGDIELSPEEMRLIHTAGFQRLHGCRQLGLTHLVYPGAKHARFEHVLGVMRMADEIAGRLTKNGEFFVEKGAEDLRRTLRFAALLHDMGHVPFGHTFEDEMPVIPKHDKPSSGGDPSRMDLEVSRVLTESNNADQLGPVMQVLRAIDASKDDQKLYDLVDAGEVAQDYLVLADIIGNTICADLFDYIKRDYMMTGIRATYDDRILNYFGVDSHVVPRQGKNQKSGKPEPVEKSYERAVIRLVRHGRVRNDALADLLDLLKLRYNLSDKVLFHPQKCAADAMLIKAVVNLKLTEQDLLRYSDDGLLDTYRDDPMIRMIRERDTFRPVFSCGWDGVHSYDDENTKQELAERLHKSPELRTTIEKEIEDRLRLPKGEDSLLLFCPRPKMTLKLVRALVQWRDGTIRRLNEIGEDDDPWTYKQVRLLEDMYPQLWRLYLFVRPGLRGQGHRIQQEFVDVLKKEAGIRATCDPAFQFYLEKRCTDYQLGLLLDRELSKAPKYISLPVEEKVTVSSDCHQKLSGIVGDDRFGQPEGKTLELRDEEAGLRLVRSIINERLGEQQGPEAQGGLVQ